MSPKEPLLATLKVCILNMQAEGRPVTDENPHLSSCCQLLEIILRKGLQQTGLGLIKRDVWHWLEQLPQQDTCGRQSQFSVSVETAAACKKLLTAQGRGRFFLRLALNRKILGNVVQHLIHTPKLLEWYDPVISVLGNEEFLEPFLSLLLVISEMEFSLNTENSSFLDESWLLPVCEVYETVPCRELGMVLRYLGSRVFVLELLEGSQAKVDKFVLPGDIIDEINGVSLRNASNGQAGIVLQRLKGKPLSFRLIRWRCGDGTVYRPMVKLLKALQQENPKFQLQCDPKPTPWTDTYCLQDGRILYILKYLGKVEVGMYGGKEVLEQGIPKVLEQRLPPKEVLLDVKETQLICTEHSSKKLMFRYHYPEISCVGRLLRNYQAVFAFCVADCPETPETSCFTCIVLQASSTCESDQIISRIASGFKHTESFV
ncbi:hypothetical protein HHUSO_G20652 [Huso huso]|uniref:RUN domain-containing protein n=1 Tax=Huso huso TaxID=61971 RepID=A0ABR0Z0J0_HUSHU